MGLQIAGVDIIRAKDGPKVLEVNSSPGLEGIEKYTGKNIAGLTIAYLEKEINKKQPTLFNNLMRAIHKKQTEG
jgi:ribosomal protein S6--L-glutamate ligase